MGREGAEWTRGLLVHGWSLVLLVGGCTSLVPAVDPEPVREPGPQVVVPNRDVEVGEALAAEDLEVAEQPMAPALGLQTAEDAIGRVARERLLAGEPVREERLAAPEAGAGLSAVVPRGMRAYRVDVPAPTAINVHPNHFVDLLATHTDTEGELRTTTPLRAILVAAVESGPGVAGITVLLTPDQVGVVVGSQGATWTPALCNEVDITGIETHGSPAVDLPAVEAPGGVVVASRDLYPGVQITSDDLAHLALLPGHDPPSEALPVGQVVGQMPAERILAGEPVRAARLADHQRGVGLTAIVPRGMRALSLPVDVVPVGMVPGSYVDLVVGVGDQVVTPVQAAYVLRVDRTADGTGVPTLALTPQQAELAAHARWAPEVTLGMSLRNDLDMSVVP